MAVVFERIRGSDQAGSLFITLRKAGSKVWSGPTKLAGSAAGMNDAGGQTGDLAYAEGDNPAIAASPARVLVVWEDTASGDALRSTAVRW
jgi:hypothetical protein